MVIDIGPICNRMTYFPSVSVIFGNLLSRKKFRLLKYLVLFGPLTMLVVFIKLSGRHTEPSALFKHGGQVRHSESTSDQPSIPNPCRKNRPINIEDILSMKPPTFLSHYKNPCWRENDTLRCLPYFHLIGTPKSATTDLFFRLSIHPEVVDNGGYKFKETWYWSWRRYGRVLTPYHFNEQRRRANLSSFIDLFNAKRIKRVRRKDGYHPLITGHGDPMDFTDFRLSCLIQQNDPEAKELVWTTPFLVKHLNPGVKLLLLLRDPIDRLYSYYFFTNRGNTSMDFHNDVVDSLNVWNQCRNTNSERFCLYNYNISTFFKVPLFSSFYSSHLKEWLKAFPREQILVIRTEDYHKDIAGTLQRIFTYLNITSLPEEDLKKLANINEIHQTKSKTNVGPILNQTKQLLLDLYRESTLELSEMLQDKRFTFTDVSFS